MDYFDTSEICLNGHLITSMASSSPQFRKKFCDECGEKTITNCPSCNSPIKGFHHIDGVVGFFDSPIPKFCDNCGNPFPWTIKQTNAAKELIKIVENLSNEEKSDFINSIDDLVKNTPSTSVAQIKYKKYIVKAGKEIAQGLRDILINIVSETVKRTIFGN